MAGDAAGGGLRMSTGLWAVLGAIIWIVVSTFPWGGDTTHTTLFFFINALFFSTFWIPVVVVLTILERMVAKTIGGAFLFLGGSAVVAGVVATAAFNTLGAEAGARSDHLLLTFVIPTICVAMLFLIKLSIGSLSSKGRT